MRSHRSLLVWAAALAVAVAGCSDDGTEPGPAATSSPPVATPGDDASPVLGGPIDVDLLVRATAAQVFEVEAEAVHVHLVGGADDAQADQDADDEAADVADEADDAAADGAGDEADAATCPADGAGIDGTTPRADDRDLVPGDFFDRADEAATPWTVHVRGFDTDDATTALSGFTARAEASVACGPHLLPGADGDATATWSEGPALGEHRSWHLVVASPLGDRAGAVVYVGDLRGGVVELSVSELGSDDPAEATARLEALLTLVTPAAGTADAQADAATDEGVPTADALERVAHLLPGAADPTVPLAGVVELGADTVTVRDEHVALNGVGPQGVYRLEVAPATDPRPWVLDGDAQLRVAREGALTTVAGWRTRVHVVTDPDLLTEDVAARAAASIGDADSEADALDVPAYSGSVWTRTGPQGTTLTTIGTVGPYVVEAALTADAEADALRDALEAVVRQLVEAFTGL